MTRELDRLFQLDAIRAFAILSVIVIHGMTLDSLRGGWAVFHVWQAVPLFIAVMGFNAYASFTRRIERHGASSDWHYIAGRMRRLLPPAIVAWLAMLAVGLYLGDVYIGPMTLLLRMPIDGPGGYFIAQALQFAALTPVLVRAFRRYPTATMLVALCGTLAFELVAPYIDVLQAHPYLFSAASLRYLVLYVAGMWIARESRADRTALTPVVLAWAAFSVIYAAYVNVTDRNLFFGDAWRWQNAFGFGYAVLIVAASVRWLPRVAHRWMGAGVGLIAAASYHIFLSQMLYFGLVQTGTLSRLALDVVVCVGSGLAFYLADTALRNRLFAMAAIRP